MNVTITSSVNRGCKVTVKQVDEESYRAECPRYPNYQPIEGEVQEFVSAWGCSIEHAVGALLMKMVFDHGHILSLGKTPITFSL